MDNTYIYAGNMTYDATVESLTKEFSTYGNVKEIKMATDEMGRFMGYAFVQMGSEEAAINAIAELNGKEMNGRACFLTLGPANQDLWDRAAL